MLIKFGWKCEAFAKGVTPTKDIHFALQMPRKHSIIVSNIPIEIVSKPKLK